MSLSQSELDTVVRAHATLDRRIKILEETVREARRDLNTQRGQQKEYASAIQHYIQKDRRGVAFHHSGTNMTFRTRTSRRRQAMTRDDYKTQLFASMMRHEQLGPVVRRINQRDLMRMCAELIDDMYASREPTCTEVLVARAPPSRH